MGTGGDRCLWKKDLRPYLSVTIGRAWVFFGGFPRNNDDMDLSIAPSAWLYWVTEETSFWHSGLWKKERCGLPKVYSLALSLSGYKIDARLWLLIEASTSFGLSCTL